MSKRWHIGCVSFLNSKPLIEPLIGREDISIHFAVPSKLVDLMNAGEIEAGLLSIVDYQAAQRELLLIPAGMIGCDGPTLTVRIFSRVPPAEIRTLHGDTDSHTSVMLAQIILRLLYGVRPAMVPLTVGAHEHPSAPQSMLLIGDKVVNAAPSGDTYPHQLDLGEEWKKLTGLPFVFAMWMVRTDAADVELAKMLSQARKRGAEMTEALLDRHAVERDWPRDLARRYFTEYLRYEVTPEARQGLANFFELAAVEGLLLMRRPLRYLELA
jgi:chorismate dehydratase